MNNIKVTQNKLSYQGLEYRCAIGSGGIKSHKIEGDHATPAGCFHIRKVFFRPDRIHSIETELPVERISKDDGWCDDSSMPEYNTLIKLPHPGKYEELWREDNVYDIVAVLGYNDEPAIPGKGSAIFLHLSRADYSATDGCIAISKNNMLDLLKSINVRTQICVEL